ncbi:MAG: hypothetical protein IKF90_00595 [Parasporobacterium sp.]|nr:hypothetical protein [Parasporobacterium sp.]
MREKCIVSEEILKELCKEWQERLRLQAWNIECGIYRERNFSNNGCDGENEYDLRNGNSLIRILDPLDYPKSRFPQDMEATLVHELLHLHFAPFEPEKDDGLDHHIMEHTICILSETLVALKRENTLCKDNFNDLIGKQGDVKCTL